MASVELTLSSPFVDWAVGSCMTRVTLAESVSASIASSSSASDDCGDKVG